MIGKRGGRDTARREGARSRRTSLRDRYRAWLRHHRSSARESLQRIIENPLAAVLTWLVVGIAMALPVGLFLSLENLRALGGEVDESSRISVFLELAVSEDAARQMAAALAQRADVKTVEFQSRETALAEFREQSGFADVLAGLADNPLPHLLLVTPAASRPGDGSGALVSALGAQPGVADVVVDMAWMQRLDRMLGLGRRLVGGLGALLLFGVLLILGNTLRLAIEGRREEIMVTRLVGGSNAFVRRPFLYMGLWFGVGGGVFAVILVLGGLLSLQGPVARLAQAYGTSWRLAGLSAADGAGLILTGGVLGLVSAWLAVSRHLDAELRG